MMTISGEKVQQLLVYKYFLSYAQNRNNVALVKNY
jgi:hypothetical protein